MTTEEKLNIAVEALELYARENVWRSNSRNPDKFKVVWRCGSDGFSIAQKALTQIATAAPIYGYGGDENGGPSADTPSHICENCVMPLEKIDMPEELTSREIVWLFELTEMRDFSKSHADFMERFEPWLAKRLKELDETNKIIRARLGLGD